MTEKRHYIVVNISCFLDVNLKINIKEKENSFAELLRNLLLLNLDYKFMLVHKIIGAKGYVIHCHNTNLERLKLLKTRTKSE